MHLKSILDHLCTRDLIFWHLLHHLLSHILAATRPWLLTRLLGHLPDHLGHLHLRHFHDDLLPCDHWHLHLLCSQNSLCFLSLASFSTAWVSMRGTLLSTYST